ncbi:hypothetical protein ACM66B_002860 [Microbotryomycetes sp. NB124-2]
MAASSSIARHATMCCSSSTRAAALAPRLGRVVHGARAFSSSDRAQFLFRRPQRHADPRQLVRELVDARQNDRLDVVARVYPQLAQSQAVAATTQASGSSSSPVVTHDTLQYLMKFVASTNRFSLLVRMFDDLETTFGFRPTAQDHHNLLLGMARARKLDRAINWLESMPTSHGIRPRDVDWNVVLDGFRRERDAQGMRTLVERMRRSNCLPNVVTYNTLISGLFEAGLVDEVRATIREMNDSAVEPDLFTETALLTGFLTINEMASASQCQQRLKRIVDEQGPSMSDTAAVNALIKFACATEGFGEALRLAVRYKERRHRLDTWTINTLSLEGAKNINSAEEGARLIDELEQVLDIDADRRTWSIVLTGVLSGPGGVKEALKVHHEARARSIQSDSKLVQPLLSALLEPSPTHETMAIAKELYEDLAYTSKGYQTSPDLSIYVTLLRACANPAASDIDFAKVLVADMRQRGLKLDGPAVTWQIIGLMRASSTWQEAFAAYDEMRALDVTVFDQNAYNTILSAFTSLSFSSSSPSDEMTGTVAPSKLVLEFLSDMRSASPPCPPNSVTYSMLLSHYSRSRGASAQHVSRLHSLIKLDSSLDPDTALFNSLMSAYSRVGAFNVAYRIWDSMLANVSNYRIRPDNVTLSIMLDTCGYDNNASKAVQVWNQVAQGMAGGGIDKRNVKNWDSYVECMCRCGMWRDAERAVFEEMGKRGEVEPARSTCETLLKMSRSGTDGAWEQRWKTWSDRVRQELPNVWQELDEHVKWSG